MTQAETEAWVQAMIVYGRDVIEHHLPLVGIVFVLGLLIGCYVA